MAFRKTTSSPSPTPAVLGGHGGVPQPAERHQPYTNLSQHPDTLRVKKPQTSSDSTRFTTISSFSWYKSSQFGLRPWLYVSMRETDVCVFSVSDRMKWVWLTVTSMKKKTKMCLPESPLLCSFAAVQPDVCMSVSFSPLLLHSQRPVWNWWRCSFFQDTGSIVHECPYIQVYK